MRRSTKKLFGDKKTYLFFCIPALIFYLSFYIYPTLSGFYYSLTDWTNMKNAIRFIGLANFAEVLKDKSLVNSIIVTLKYTFTMTILQNVLGFIFALIITTNLRGNKIYRVIIFLPFILPTVVSSNIWVYIYNPINGLISLIAKAIGFGEVNILGNPDTALYGVVATNLWQLMGFSLIIYYAGLQSIPMEMIEASRVDGANKVTRLFCVKIPLMMPAITINIMFSLINGLKVFDYIFVMTNGGPGSATRSISAMIYFSAFNEGLFGYASAIGVTLFFAITAISYVILRLLRKREVEA